MTTRYYQPLPQIPNALLIYCQQQNYALSLKKKYIIAQLINLSSEATIDDLMFKTSFFSNSISRSSIYLVLQWMTAHQLVRKSITDDNLKAFYTTNFERLQRISADYMSPASYPAEKSKLILVS